MINSHEYTTIKLLKINWITPNSYITCRTIYRIHPMQHCKLAKRPKCEKELRTQMKPKEDEEEACNITGKGSLCLEAQNQLIKVEYT